MLKEKKGKMLGEALPNFLGFVSFIVLSTALLPDQNWSALAEGTYRILGIGCSWMQPSFINVRSKWGMES